MSRLATPIDHIKTTYDVVVIGSGYGGAIAASRAARAGRTVCLLERGREFQPGEYPDTLLQGARELQIDSSEADLGSPTGLYDLHIGEDINVFRGCGLGGTSLVNAGVALRPDPRVFADPRWPAPLRASGALDAAFQRAEEMLRPEPYPTSFPGLRKLDALAASAARLQAPVYRPPINVNFRDQVNHVGVQQQACVLCGDCVSGCNYGAKNTLIMNYLPDAVAHGAEIYTEVRVLQLEPVGSAWAVQYQPTVLGRRRFAGPPLFVTGSVVVLAAGALGSTEILLRSKANQVSLSDHVGDGFTGNGDVLAFATGTTAPIDGIGHGHHPAGDLPPVGPCITGVIDMRGTPQLHDGMVIEEGSIPGLLATLLPGAFRMATSVFGRDQGSENGRPAHTPFAWFRDKLHLGASDISHLQTYLVMAHDDSSGRMSLDDDDRLHIAWPGAGSQPIFTTINQRLADATRAIGGTYVIDPVWSRLCHRDLVTVHALGGCVMGESAETGVVDHRGRVFAGPSGDATYDNLYVMDGSVIPCALGVNPLLTISAVAEHCMQAMSDAHGWQLDTTLTPPPPAPPSAPATVGVQFTERMGGWISRSVLTDHAAAADAGHAEGSPASQLTFILTITADDVNAMLDDPDHAALMVGTVVAPALSAQPLTVTGGRFNLFVQDPADASARQMRYRMTLADEAGAQFLFTGYKEMRSGHPLSVWHDTTTLYVDVYSGDAEDPAKRVARGVLRISPTDFLRQIRTMTAPGATSHAQAVEALARFGRLFAGTLWDVYGHG